MRLKQQSHLHCPVLPCTLFNLPVRRVATPHDRTTRPLWVRVLHTSIKTQCWTPQASRHTCAHTALHQRHETDSAHAHRTWRGEGGNTSENKTTRWALCVRAMLAAAWNVHLPVLLDGTQWSGRERKHSTQHIQCTHRHTPTHSLTRCATDGGCRIRSYLDGFTSLAVSSHNITHYSFDRPGQVALQGRTQLVALHAITTDNQEMVGVDISDDALNTEHLESSKIGTHSTRHVQVLLQLEHEL